MLPFNAQSANQAFEDAGALNLLFSNLPGKDIVSERMRMFEEVRRKRANRQQIVSGVPAEEVKNLGDMLKYYEDEGAPTTGNEEGTRERILRELRSVVSSEHLKLY